MIKRFFFNAFNSNLINALGKITSYYFLSRLVDPNIFSSLMIAIVLIDILAMILDFGHSTSVFTHTSSKNELKNEFESIFFLKTIIFVLLSPIFMLFNIAFILVIGPLLLFNFQNVYYDRLFSFKTVFIRYLFDAFLRVLLINLFSNDIADLNSLVLIFYLPIIILAFYDLVKILFNNTAIFKTTFQKSNLKFQKLLYFTAKGFAPYADGLIVMLLRRADIFYVSFFLGSSISGQFAALFALINFLPMISSAFNRVILSFVLEKSKAHQLIIQNRYKIIVFGFLFALITSVIMLPIYEYTYPENLRINNFISLLCFIGVAINFPYQTLILPLYKLKKLEYGLKIRIVQLIIQTCASLILINYFGLIGVPLSLILVRIAGIFMIDTFLRKIKKDEN